MSGMDRMRSLGLAIVLVGLAMVSPTKAQVAGPGLPNLQWTTLEQASKLARAQKKNVFVMVYADWCGYCHKMEATTFRDPGVIAKMNAGFVPAKVNGESGRAFVLDGKNLTENRWAMSQGVQGFPALIVLDSKGRTVVNFPGYLSAPQASRLLSDVREFVNAGGIDKLGDFLAWAEARQS